MDLSIIIVHYKTKELLKYCLKRIYQAAPKLNYEIIVVDNHSEDGTPLMLKEHFPLVKCYSAPKNLGFAAGNNLGIRQSSGAYILTLNPDIAVLPGAIEHLHEFLVSHPETGVVGPQLVNPDKTIQFSCARFPTPLTPLYRRTILGQLSFGKKAVAHYFMASFDHQQTQEVDWLLGACLMFPRLILKKVGPMDERFFLFFEDVDFCRRCWEAGLKVMYLPPAKMVHYHRRPSANDARFSSLFSLPTRAHIASGIKYFLKYRGKKMPHSP